MFPWIGKCEPEPELTPQQSELVSVMVHEFIEREPGQALTPQQSETVFVMVHEFIRYRPLMFPWIGECAPESESTPQQSEPAFVMVHEFTQHGHLMFNLLLDQLLFDGLVLKEFVGISPTTI